MKKSILILTGLLFVFLFVSNRAMSQSMRQIENKQLAEILAFMEDTKSTSNNNMTVRVYLVGLPSDTIRGARSEEIYNRLIIAVSETGEYPKYKVYELPKVLNPSGISFSTVDPFTIRIEFVHGKYTQRVVSVLEANGRSLGLSKIQ